MGINTKSGKILKRFVAEDGREVTLRTVQKKELADVNRIFLQVFGEEKYSLDLLNEKHKTYPSLFIGLFKEKQIIGIVFGWPDPALLVVSALAVLKNYRRKGIGTALLKAFDENAVREGFDNFVLGARWEAVPFYRSYGLQCFVNTQVKIDQIPWDKIEYLREKYEIKSAVVFTRTTSDEIVSKIVQAFKVKVGKVESKFESVSIQSKAATISENVLEEMKKDFNAYSTQFCFKKRL